MDYDVRAVRAHFPALLAGAAHFDGPGGSQVPDTVVAAVAGTLGSAIANRDRLTAAGARADDIVLGARDAVADLLGVVPAGVVFGRSMTQLTYDFARALAKTWTTGDEVVVSRLDHDANIRPWIQAAASVGAVVRWIDFDPASGALTADHAAEVIGERTRLVAVTGASNLIGSCPDVAGVTALAHAAGALAYVDGVHLTPHAPIDVTDLGADLYACSPYKFLGPHCGVVAGRPEVLAAIHPDKLLPSSDAVPERFELGTLPYELLAGTTAAIDFLAALDPAALGSRRARLLTSMTGLAQHEELLCRRLHDGLAALPGVTLHAAAARRTPTLLLSVAGVPATEVASRLAADGVNAPAGSFYAVEAARRLGLPDGGAVRAGLAPYTDDDDVDRLIAALARVSAAA